MVIYIKDKNLGKLRKPSSSKTLASFCAKIADDKLANKILVLDLQTIDSAPCDYFVICSCDSQNQVRAVLEAVLSQCRDANIAHPKVEGNTNMMWVLVDFFDVVMHIMLKETREYYRLEKLWSDAKISILDENKKLKKFNIQEESVK